MRSDDLTRHGQHVMTVCNACRYCEQYCPVFPAMERRRTFTTADLSYLANLCHNCGECLYACQYAPPHVFAIDVPRTLARIRLRAYEEYCWPRFLARSFRRNNLRTGAVLTVLTIGVMAIATAIVNGGRLPQPAGTADFYAVVPHGVMVAMFGSVFLFALVAIGIGAARFWSDAAGETRPIRDQRALVRALGDVLSLRHLHPAGADCVAAEEQRTPYRRWWHHCTFYGFALCFASTTVAAVYHAFGWIAPHEYTSLPVILGTAGGVGLMVGPAGLFVERRRRDPALADDDQRGTDESFLALLFLSALTGLLLLALRSFAVMAPLLIVHLGVVLALFLTLPYGKFVHGVYRTQALIKFAGEGLAEESTALDERANAPSASLRDSIARAERERT